MTIIAGLFAGSFGRILGLRKGALAAVIGISVYTILVGANAAVVRAAIMGGLSIFARQVGRRQHGLNTLAITAAGMALFNPMILGDIGFQLSVAATLGLILYAEVFANAFKKAISRWVEEQTSIRVTRPVGEYILFTLAAQLDWLVVGGVEEAQLGALPRVIERFPPENVLWSGPERGTRAARNLQDALISAGIPIIVAETGQVLDLGRGASLQVLQAGERGAILMVEWGSFRTVLPIGVGFDELEALEYGKQIGPVSAMLLADNGYAPSNPVEWIYNLSPEIALLSVSGKDGRGMPSRETLEAFDGYTLLRTDQNGWIELSTDGEGMWVEVER